MPASFHLDMEGVRQGTEFPEALASCLRAALGMRERDPVRGAAGLQPFP